MPLPEKQIERSSSSFFPSDPEELLRLGTIVVALLYFGGLLAMNTYLLTIGVADFTPFSARYVITGLLVTSPMLVGILTAIIAIVGTSDVNPRVESSIGMTFAYFLLIAIIVDFAMVVFILRDTNEIWLEVIFASMLCVGSYIVAYSIGVAYFGVVAIENFIEEHAPVHFMEKERFLGDMRMESGQYSSDGEIDLVRETERFEQEGAALIDISEERGVYVAKWRDPPKRDANFKRRGPYRWKGHSYVGLIVCTALLVAVFMGGVVLVPSVPTQYGGAKPERIKLIFQVDTNTQIEEIGIPMSESLVSRPVELLWEADSYLVVREPGSSEVVRIADSMIAGWRTGDG